MAKFPRPYFRAQRGTWCVQLHGKQITLGSDKEEAFCLYHKLMAEQRVSAQRVVGDDIAVVTVLDLFLDWCEKNRSPRTYKWYRDYLQSFVKSIPAILPVIDLKPFHVQQWIDGHRGWKTSKRGAIISVQRAFNWAAKQGRIENNPVQHMEKPPQGRREQIVPPDVYRNILAQVKDDPFRALLELSWETGARPQELFTVEASYVDLANARWVFPIRESKGKRYQRVVYLTERAIGITQDAMLKYPEGPMLRNLDGNPWSKVSVCSRFQRIRDKIGTKYSLYSIRHSYCTFALATGKLDAVTVSHLMGHRDTSMISRHYSHLTQLTDHMRDAANRVRGSGAST